MLGGWWCSSTAVDPRSEIKHPSITSINMYICQSMSKQIHSLLTRINLFRSATKTCMVDIMFTVKIAILRYVSFLHKYISYYHIYSSQYIPQYPDKFVGYPRSQAESPLAQAHFHHFHPLVKSLFWLLKSAGEIELPPNLAPKLNIYFSFAFVFVDFDLYSIPIHIS